MHDRVIARAFYSLDRAHSGDEGAFGGRVRSIADLRVTIDNPATGNEHNGVYNKFYVG